MKILLLLCFTSATYCYVPARNYVGHPNHEQASHVTFTNISSHLPDIKNKNIAPEFHTIIRQMKTFATKYETKAETMTKLSKPNLMQEEKRLEKEFNKDFKQLKAKVGQLRALQGRRSLMGGSGSIFNKLNDFLQAIHNLPVQIHCLIYDCTDISSMPFETTKFTTTTTTTTENPEDSVIVDSYDQINTGE